MTNDDPFMPAVRRFPRSAWPPEPSEQPASAMRPFVLRGARPVDDVATARHRTQPHQTPHRDVTSPDGPSKIDTWYEQDD